MTDNNNGGNFNSFVVGGLVVVVAILGYLFYTGKMPGQKPTTSITIETPAAPAAPAPAK